MWVRIWIKSGLGTVPSKQLVQFSSVVDRWSDGQGWIGQKYIAHRCDEEVKALIAVCRGPIVKKRHFDLAHECTRVD